MTSTGTKNKLSLQTGRLQDKHVEALNMALQAFSLLVFPHFVLHLTPYP